MIAVRRATIDARRVFNLTAPRWLPQVASQWAGRAPWHDARYDPLRDLIEKTYIDAFDRGTGHYARLEESIRRAGVWNPVMLTTGPLLRRNPAELPPAVARDPARVVCEYVGGSRLLIAARLGLKVPAIINDAANLFPDAPIVSRGANVTHLFRDKPRRVLWGGDGSLYVNFFTYGHFPAVEQEARRREQIAFRKTVIAECISAAQQWSLEHDRP